MPDDPQSMMDLIERLGLPVAMWIGLLLVAWKALSGPIKGWVEAQVRLTDTTTQAVRELKGTFESIDRTLRDQHEEIKAGRLEIERLREHVRALGGQNPPSV